jgi:hypothetical protein
MPHLIILHFQPTTMAFLTKSTLATQISKTLEIGEEMEINSRKVDIDVGTIT